MLLKMVSQNSETPPSLFDRTWVAEDIDGKGVIDNAQSTFSVASDGKITGSGRATAISPRHQVERRFDQDRKGRRDHDGLCPGTHGSGAEVLRRPGAGPTAYRIDGDGKLFLVDANGVDIVRFASEG